MLTARILARGLIVGLLGVGVAPARAASPDDRAAARQQLNQAHEAKKRGRLAEACGKLAEVERLDPKLPTVIELAECTEEQGKPVEALGWWTIARDRAKHDEKPQSKARAEARLVALQKRVAHLALQLAPGTPAGAQVLRDDVALDAASLATEAVVNPGEHTIVVKLEGHDDAEYAIRLADGEHQSLAIAPGPASSSKTVAAPPPAIVAPVPTPLAPATVSPPASAPPVDKAAAPPTGFWTAPRKTGVIVGAVGVLGVAGGSVLCLAGKPDGADTRLALGGAALAMGSVLLVSSVVVLASAPGEAAQHAGLRVSPSLVVVPGAGMLGASGRF